jgi:ABC-type proline/glycine betaine transport system permease subunit
MKANSILRSWPLALLLALLVAAIGLMPLTAPFFHWLFPDLLHPVYARASFFELTLAHCELVFTATFVAACLGIGAGLYVTRENGKEFLPLAGALAAVGQTFPPVAVLALAIPLLGYGAAPTLVALVLYSTLPILEATIAGLYAVPNAARDAAVGLGFSPSGLLWRGDLRRPAQRGHHQYRHSHNRIERRRFIAGIAHTRRPLGLESGLCPARRSCCFAARGRHRPGF